MKTLKKVMAVLLSMTMAFSVMATPANAAVTDIEEGSWYAASAERWVDAGIMNGISDSEWAPAAEITRAEVVTILVRILGLSEAAAENFTDVEDGAWYAEYVAIAKEAGISNGKGDDTFGPDDKITREQAFVMIARALQMRATTTDVAAAKSILEAAYDEADQLSDWAAILVLAMHEAGYIKGCETARDDKADLHPEHNITRAEVAVILDRMIGVYVDAEGNVSETAEENQTVGGFIVSSKNYEGNVEVVVEDGKVTVITEEGEVTVEPEEEVTLVSGDETKDVPVDEDSETHIGGAEEGETTIHTHEYVENCTNCAAAHTPYEVCEVGCNKVKTYEEVAAHPHVFVEGVCECCGMTDEDAMKFMLKVSSECEGETNYVSLVVTNDYVAEIVITDGKVSASNVTLYAAMQNVDSLGVANKREHEQTFATGLAGDPELSVWLSNAWEFNKATINAHVDGVDTTYVLTQETDAEGNAVITGTPNSVEATREAWQALTSHVTTSTQEASDSYINIANGSFLVIGDEILCFEKTAEGDLKLDNFGDLSAMSKMIRDMVQSYGYESNDTVVAHLAAGTALAVSNSIAVLDDNCTITIEAPGYLSDEDVAGVLTEIKTAEGGYAMASNLVQLLNTLIGKIGNDAVVDVTIDFEEPVEKDTKFYFGITANNADKEGTTTVDLEVFDDYSLEINLPMNKISAAEVTLEVAMKNVGSLGVNGVRRHEMTVNTGMTATGDLNFWMSNAPLFEEGYIYYNIEGNRGVYTLTSDMDPDWVTVTGTTDTEAARAAWAALTANVSTKTQEAADSYIKVAKDSSVRIGNEVLVWEEGADDMILDNFSNLSGVKQEIKDSIKLVEVDYEAPLVDIVVKAGTELAVSNSVATLDKDCNIIIELMKDGATLEETPEEFVGILSQFRAEADSNEALVKAFFNLLNNMVAAVDEYDVLVTIDFAE